MKTYTDKVLYYMINEWDVDSKSIPAGVREGLFSIIKKDESCEEDVQESAKNAALFMKNIQEKEIEKRSIGLLKSAIIFVGFIWQGGSHMFFKK